MRILRLTHGCITDQLTYGKFVSLGAILALCKFLDVHPLQVFNLPSIDVWSGEEGQPITSLPLSSLMMRRWA